MINNSQAVPAIALAGVNLSLGHGAARVHILKDIDLHIGTGEAIGLVGPSGSGKSTLLMVMAGLERADTGTVAVTGRNLSTLNEDALARFRGRHIGIVFQSFHLIPTMTALENVAVPLELAGATDAHARAREELAAVGLSERLDHYPAELSGGEQQRVAVARALAPDPAIVVADEPTGNLDEDTGKQIIESALCGSCEAKDHAGACHPRRHARGALRARRAAALRPCRWCEHLMSVTESIAPTSRWLPLRFALRELRSGLNGFYVFILCIALGSMAIAGVGSLAASLTDGLAREGRVILGGDLAFTLIQREIAPNERAFLQERGQVSSAATMRAMARTPNGQATLVEMKAVDAAYPLFGQIKLDPSIAARRRVGATRWRFRRRRRSDADGAARNFARCAAHDRQYDVRNSRHSDKRARQARRRHRLRPAFAGERGRIARDRFAAAGQSGALALPPAPACK